MHGMPRESASPVRPRTGCLDSSPAAMELDKVADVSHSIPCCWTTCPRGCPLTMCIVYWYTTHMLKSYRHKGVKQFAETGSKAGIQPEHANRLRRLLSALDAATSPANMNAPGYALHPLKGDMEGHWAVRVSGNWRLTFAFEGEDAILVDYQDYH